MLKVSISFFLAWLISFGLIQLSQAAPALQNFAYTASVVCFMCAGASFIGWLYLSIFGSNNSRQRQEWSSNESEEYDYGSDSELALTVPDGARAGSNNSRQRPGLYNYAEPAYYSGQPPAPPAFDAYDNLPGQLLLEMMRLQQADRQHEREQARLDRQHEREQWEKALSLATMIKLKLGAEFLEGLKDQLLAGSQMYQTGAASYTIINSAGEQFDAASYCGMSSAEIKAWLELQRFAPDVIKALPAPAPGQAVQQSRQPAS